MPVTPCESASRFCFAKWIIPFLWYSQVFKNGFGELSSEFWLGHEKISLVTSSETQLSLLSGDVINGQAPRFVVLYEWFMLGREAGSYQLFYSKSSGNEDKLSPRKPFVTADRVGDYNCGSTYAYGSYWHEQDSSCLGSNLFGKTNEWGSQGIQWFGRDTGIVTNWKWKIKTFQGKFHICLYHIRDFTPDIYTYSLNGVNTNIQWSAGFVIGLWKQSHRCL